jgi:hypothetical protein
VVVVDPIRKIFDNHDAFPMSFAYKSTKSSLSELPDHFHDWYEIVYVYRGRGTFFIDHTFYEMKQGDLFLIPGNTIHRATPEKESPVTSTAIYFSPSIVQLPALGEDFSYLQGFEQAATLRNYKFEMRSPQSQHLELLLDVIENEFKHPTIGQRQSIFLHLLQLLLTIQRDMTTDIKSSQLDGLSALSGCEKSSSILMNISVKILDSKHSPNKLPSRLLISAGYLNSSLG